METIASIAVLGLVLLVVVAMSGIPKLMAAYSTPNHSQFKPVGVFFFDRDRLRLRGFICRVSANTDGLLLYPIFPIWIRSAYIPWSDIWLVDVANPLRPSKQIGFLKCPEVSYYVTSLFGTKVQRVIQQQLPIEVTK